MKLYMIRHGETDWNVAGRMQGSKDIELNENGIAQAQQLYGKVKKEGYQPVKVYTSPQKRAFKTGQILADAMNIECVKMPGLEEANFGDWEGKTWEQVKTEYPEAFEKWEKNRRYVRTPNGECYQDVVERVVKAIDHIMETEKEDVAVVTHGAVIMSLMCFITDTPFEKMWSFKPENTGITVIDTEDIKKAVSASAILL
ncbi:MAG: alpha-ribazole phosphatase [Lachnospiraceae bacterium]|nr:alpha-ribazole phosphatase [Lachnospiraceae bacterium]